MTHTPAPWSCGFSDAGVAFINARGVCVARLDDGEIDANAKLIAASPDLLDCLSLLLEIYSPSNTKQTPLAEKARAVIAKATL